MERKSQTFFLLVVGLEPGAPPSIPDRLTIGLLGLLVVVGVWKICVHIYFCVDFFFGMCNLFSLSPSEWSACLWVKCFSSLWRASPYYCTSLCMCPLDVCEDLVGVKTFILFVVVKGGVEITSTTTVWSPSSCQSIFGLALMCMLAIFVTLSCSRLFVNTTSV